MRILAALLLITTVSSSQYGSPSPLSKSAVNSIQRAGSNPNHVPFLQRIMTDRSSL